MTESLSHLPPAYYSDDLVRLYHGDCLDVLRELPGNSVDAVVTDPPYDLTAGKKGGTGPASVNLDSPYGRSRISTGNGGFMGKDWDATGIAFDPNTWREVMRVLKPGGHLLAFGGSRTWHRLVSAVEDAGFEIRDSIAWLYGSGFPKSLDVPKAIDKAAGAEREVVGPGQYSGRGRRTDNKVYGKATPSDAEVVTLPATEAAQQWHGWGTALKPAFEPIVVARKPLVGTVAANVLEHGTGALNIDACRVAMNDADREAARVPSRDIVSGNNNRQAPGGRNGQVFEPAASGRWPTNVVLDESQAAELDHQTAVTRSRIGKPRGAASGEGWGMAATGSECDDQGGASRFFPVFRYEAKAPTSERPRDGETAHPTVKPLDLMRWLVRLVTPPGGTVLEPFAGSGATAEACVIEGFQCIAIEREADYLPLIVARLSKPIQAALDFGEVS